MKAVEVRFRQLAAASASSLGVPLIRQAFAPDQDGKTAGSLTDVKSERGEQQARLDLFAGALGPFKNPASHRIVDYADLMKLRYRHLLSTAPATSAYPA